ncbi:D-amino acid aminotransferase [Brucella melitensis]|nr:D-amino acid aminotransferase [Brucella melitensis]
MCFHVDDLALGSAVTSRQSACCAGVTKEIAKNAGCDEAWMIEDGYVTKRIFHGLYRNQDDVIVTRPNSNFTLPGLHAAFVLQLITETA